jgi:hypothetical protein
MANGMGVQLAVFLVPAAIIVTFLVLKMKKARPASSDAVAAPAIVEVSRSVQIARPAEPAPPKPVAASNPVETASASAKSAGLVTAVAAAPASLPVRIDIQGALATTEDRREQILATISENIRKSLPMRQPAQSSPIPYSESKTRNTEYVRVKKDIITPHDQIRFSILKDWLSTNMLAIFRRASFGWKTPEDLIALLPEYLAAEAEILNGQVLLVGTQGHNEKLAVPIRALDATSGLGECFDFVSDVRIVTNTPAVLRTSDTEFEVVSRGVITRSLFTNAIEQGQERDMKLLMEKSAEQLHQNYTAAIRQLESAVSADAH